MSNKPARPSLEPVRATDGFPEVEPSSRNQPPPSLGGMRGIVDALLQGSLVELFQAYGVACAPLRRDARSEAERYPDLSAVIGFTSPAASGRLILSMPPEVLDLMKGERSLQGRKRIGLESWSIS